MGSKLEIYLIRHGKTEANELGWVGGEIDFPLSEEGVLEAKNLSSTLAEMSFDLIYCSPLKRATQTLELALPGKIGINDGRIKEFNAGKYSKSTYAAVYAETPKLQSWGSSLDLRFGDGDSLSEFNLRVKSFYAEMLERKNDKKIAVFTHGGVINLLLYQMFQLDIRSYPWFDIDNCGITKIRVEDLRWRVCFLNRRFL